MTHGQRFTLVGQTYYIDLVGPKTVGCTCEDGSYENFDTEYLKRVLNEQEVRRVLESQS